MDFDNVLEILKVLVIIFALSGLFYVYFKYEGVRKGVKKILPFIPYVFAFLGARTVDKKGVFDQHDFWVLLGRVTERIKDTIEDPTNRLFEDVEDEVFEIVSDELSRYKVAGVAGIPDINDPSIRTQVRIVFETIKGVAGEDSAGSNRES